MYRRSAISMLQVLLKEQIWLVECLIIADGLKIITNCFVCLTVVFLFILYILNMMSDTSFNSMRKGEGNKKMIPCRYFAMGKCNKGNDCPYEPQFSDEW